MHAPAARRLLLAALLLCSGAAGAQGSPNRYTFDSAQERLTATSSALGAARANADASRSSAEAVGSLNLPIVSIDAQAFRYQKTLEVSLDALRNAAGAVNASINGFLASLPSGALPPGAAGQIATVGNSALARIPDSLSTTITDNIWRPTMTLYWPIYTGGLSGATQDAAQAGVRQADAELLAASDTLSVQLVAAYFGQQLAAQVRATSQQNLARFEVHLGNAQRMERQGVLSKAQRLQVQVARDAAQRQALRADNDYDTAAAVLTRLLKEGGPIDPATPLFALSAPLPPQQDFVDVGHANAPQLQRLQALRDATRSGVKAAQAQWLPKVYGFGSYNFNSNNAVLPDPDWIVGIGLHYTLSSNVDRRSSEAAAQARARQADAAIEQADNDLETVIIRSYQGVETARRQFMLLASNIEAAEENVRVHTLGFREGEATATALIDAQVALSVAQTQRAAAAFEYDLALAQLLAASGQMHEYTVYVAKADQRVNAP